MPEHVTPKVPKSMSQRQYAQHRGVRLSTVQKALKSGRIGKTSNGKIDPARADADWERNTAPRPAIMVGVVQRKRAPADACAMPMETVCRRISELVPRLSKQKAKRIEKGARRRPRVGLSRSDSSIERRTSAELPQSVERSTGRYLFPGVVVSGVGD